MKEKSIAVRIDSIIESKQTYLDNIEKLEKSCRYIRYQINEGGINPSQVMGKIRNNYKNAIRLFMSLYYNSDIQKFIDTEVAFLYTEKFYKTEYGDTFNNIDAILDLYNSVKSDRHKNNKKKLECINNILDCLFELIEIIKNLTDKSYKNRIEMNIERISGKKEELDSKMEDVLSLIVDYKSLLNAKKRIDQEKYVYMLKLACNYIITISSCNYIDMNKSFLNKIKYLFREINNKYGLNLEEFDGEIIDGCREELKMARKGSKIEKNNSYYLNKLLTLTLKNIKTLNEVFVCCN